MLQFKTIELKDKSLLDSYLLKADFRNCDFSFSNIFCWKNRYQTTYDIVNGFLVIRFIGPENNMPYYMMPLGTGNLAKVLDILIKDAESHGFPFGMLSVTNEMFKLLDKAMPDTFVFTPMRGAFDYIYETENLKGLVGKKYQSKRNHINKFKSDHPDFEFIPITKELIPACLEMQKQWCIDNGCSDSDMLNSEAHAVRTALNNFEELQLSGGVIKTDGKLIAFSFGQQITDDTFGVHVEKALNGAYAIINQQIAEHVAYNFKYMNREEDLGIEPLRKAKMSYQPTILLEKGSVQLKK